MKTKSITALIIFGVLIIAGSIIFIKSQPTISLEDSQIIGSHFTLYVLTGCSHCENQLNMFGSNVKYLNIIDCYKTPNECSGINAYPTWKINGVNYEGTKTLQQINTIMSVYFLPDIEGKITNISVNELNKSCPLN